MNSRLHEVFFRAKKKYLPYIGVLGVGYGSKIRKKTIVAQQSIIVLVERKLPEDQVPKGQVIPPDFEGFPVDIRVPRIVMTEEEQVNPVPGFIETDYEWINLGKIHLIHLRQNSPKNNAEGKL